MLDIRNDLIVPLDSIDTDQMLEFWRWLIPHTHQPLFATALGDLFLIDTDGLVLWLDMAFGDLQTIADNQAVFRQSLADPENDSRWFGSVLVDTLRASSRVLGPGECYSYRRLWLLGGRNEPDNFVIRDVLKHFRIWGQIHEQIEDYLDFPELWAERFEVLE